MPETYTKEQIDEAMKFLRGITSDSETMNSSIMILLSALSTAEKNNADWQEYNAELLHRAETAERERDALKAQVVELEARLQGAVKQWETFARKIWGSGRVMNVEQFVAEGLSAIVGKKEGV